MTPDKGYLRGNCDCVARHSTTYILVIPVVPMAREKKELEKLVEVEEVSREEKDVKVVKESNATKEVQMGSVVNVAVMEKMPMAEREATNFATKTEAVMVAGMPCGVCEKLTCTCHVLHAYFI